MRGTASSAARLVAMTVSLSFAVAASPIAQPLEKRRPTLSDSDTLTINDTAPLDAILLVGVALISALCCLILALWNICVPSLSGTREVREERARAKTELRLKGAGGVGSGGHSPTRMLGEKKGQISIEGETTTNDSDSRIASSAPSRFDRVPGPRIAPNMARSVRASRGYSTYSKHDIASRPSYSQERSLSMLAVPALPAAYNDGNSSPSRSSGSVATSSSPPLPWHARPSSQERSKSFGSHARRISTTVGRGTDLYSKRSKRATARNVHVNPQSIDPTYAHARRLSPRSSATELNDPLSGYELKRYTTDPTDSRESSRRNSAMNALDFFNLGINGLFGGRGGQIDSGSDNHSNEANNRLPLLHSNPAATSRSRPLDFYELEHDASANNGTHQQDAALLESGGTPSDHPKAGWRAWGGRI